ncbi:hypothetical protein CEP53_005121 [Fusarium sp. AF-6]|nr:hypothetical protein CEP53_005121 [Fusarium sp. AF-6]
MAGLLDDWRAEDMMSTFSVPCDDGTSTDWRRTESSRDIPSDKPPDILSLPHEVSKADTSLRPQGYACPYRMRNPRAFNVADFPTCASHSFSSITLLNDYERGITEDMENALRDRRSKRRVVTWEDLWRVIFPDCDRIPSIFMPPHITQQRLDTLLQTCLQVSDQSMVKSKSRPSPSPYIKQETPDSQIRRTPRTSASLQQVGLARVRIEILALSEQHRCQRRHETESLDGSTGETDSEKTNDDDCSSEVQDSDDSPGDASAGSVSASNNTSQGQASASGTGQPTPRRKTNRPEETEDDGNGDDRPKKRRREQPRAMEPARARFACPYQAYEPWRDCFKPSQRNRKGGCDSISISRLKDHMARKHMSSYRCPRCWKQFSARHKVQEHLQGNYVHKEMPTYERFMTLEQETEVENCIGTEPEDTWWKLFRLLIPGMAAEDLLQLKGRFFPYYVHVDMSLTIPSLNLSNISFADSPAQPSGQVNGDAATLAVMNSPSDPFSGLGNTSLTSQSFTVPIYGADTHQLSSVPSFEGSDQDIMSLLSTQQSAGSDSTTSSDRINRSTSASSLNETPNPASDTSQMQRNYERQKTRAAQAETENGELRATISASREQVRDAAVLLDGVLGRGNLDSEVYEQVSRAAEILISVTGRLR